MLVASEFPTSRVMRTFAVMPDSPENRGVSSGVAAPTADTPTLVVGRKDGRCTCRQGCVLDRARLPLGPARESAVLEGPEKSGFLPVSRSSGKGPARSDRNFNGRMELWNCFPGAML